MWCNPPSVCTCMGVSKTLFTVFVSPLEYLDATPGCSASLGCPVARVGWTQRRVVPPRAWVNPARPGRPGRTPSQASRAGQSSRRRVM